MRLCVGLLSVYKNYELQFTTLMMMMVKDAKNHFLIYIQEFSDRLF